MIGKINNWKLGILKYIIYTLPYGSYFLSKYLYVFSMERAYIGHWTINMAQLVDQETGWAKA